MRLLLDAHVSGRRIGKALEKDGHDVRAIDQERALDGMTDEDLLALATEEGRVLVTFNVADFPSIARDWAAANKAHASLAIVVGLDHGEFGAALRAVRRALEVRPGQAEWHDCTSFLARDA
jgi:predicted nuclease of predicted toxin-antitoxin system